MASRIDKITCNQKSIQSGAFCLWQKIETTDYDNITFTSGAVDLIQTCNFIDRYQYQNIFFQAKSGDEMDAFEDRISELMQDLEKEKMKSEHHQQSEDNFKLKLEEIESEKTSLEQVLAELVGHTVNHINEITGMFWILRHLFRNRKRHSFVKREMVYSLQ